MSLSFIKKINKLYLYIGVCVLAFVMLVLGIILYIRHIDNESKKIESGSDLVFVLKEKKEESNSFYVANIKEDLNEYINKKKIKKLETITYKIGGEDFNILVETEKNDGDDEYTFTVIKITDSNFKINARMNYKKVNKIKYRSEEDATVLRIETDYDSNYFAMSPNGEYFLGDDIDEIIYKDNRFYYLTYNPKYKSLIGVESCTNKLIKSIDGFSYSEYYYKEGKINFLDEYYQKIYTSSVSVKNYCNSLK